MRIAAACLLPSVLAAQVLAAAPMPRPDTTLLQFIDAQEGEGHTDISAQFGCTVSYLGNAPRNHGNLTVVTLRLGPDCGPPLMTITPELPLIGGTGSHLVSAVRLESSMPGEVTLELRFNKEQDFVLAPTTDGRGLRIRLLTADRKQAGGYVMDVTAAEGYAVNLQSSQQGIDASAVSAASAALGAPSYVSETDVEGEHWYRLRVGPFTTRAEAQRVLDAALTNYPRAWIAINDETADLNAVARANVSAVAASGQTDAPLSDEQRTQLLHEARTALAQRQFPQAVDLLTRLLRQPEYPARAEAQELIGIVRERAGQLAHAKAEYEEYLRRYPNGAAEARVRSRLVALVSAKQEAVATGDFAAPVKTERWTLSGSGSIGYEYGRDQINAGATNTTSTALNAALVYGDLLMRERGERYDVIARVNSGYTANMVANTGGSQDRTSAAYLEVDDTRLSLTARVGRQSLVNEGSIGLFDGVYVSYQVAPKITLSAAGGLPAYSAYSAVSTNETFGTAAVEFGPYHQAWIFDAYLFDSQSGSDTERRAMGFETRYSQPGRSAVVLADYDFYFQRLNAATLIGNLGVGREWTLGMFLDHRLSPLLQLSNALQGQSATDLTVLSLQFTPSQIRQLALDRTATSNSATLSATHPLGEHWQFMTNASVLELSGTIASGGVIATQSSGLDKDLAVQFSGSSLLQAGDLHFFGIQYDDSPAARSATASWDARFVLHGAWRLGPRLSLERLSDPALGGSQWLYLPELRSDWTGKRSMLEFIGGYQLEYQQLLPGQTPGSATDARHLYVSMAYRVRL
jgi:tetratricopeptide (TPR) repeat protein